MKKIIAAIILVGMMGIAIPVGLAQSNVDIYFIACGDQAVIDLSGTVGSGYDIYYQVFSGASATGAAITSLRRVVVDGDYAVSDNVTYNEGAAVALGGVASAVVSIAREDDSSRSLYETTVDDLNDGCNTPSNPLVDSLDVDAGEVAAGKSERVLVSTSGIISPFGGELNPVYESREPVVQIGARASEATDPNRTENPGLLFAECDQYPLSHPGTLYDTDNLVLFWSWFAKTRQQVQDHIDHAQYSVKINGEFPLFVERSEITQLNGNYWVFYIAHLGDAWRPGSYGIEYKLHWDEVISDGYDDFGPDTEHVEELSTCTFDIQTNPWGVQVVHESPPVRPLP